MQYNFKKNIIKNQNNSYTLNIILPNKLSNIKYKIYSQRFLVQSGYFENSKISNEININLDKLEIIFLLINADNIEYFELLNLKNLYNKILENIKINFKKNNFSNHSFLTEDDDDSDEEEDNDEDDNDLINNGMKIELNQENGINNDDKEINDDDDPIIIEE